MRTVGRSHALERPPLSVPLEGGPAIRLRCGHHPGARSYGTVFLAEQRPSYRLVALKVLNHSSHASETIERLQALRLSLHALGEHAARVYDVGVLAQGRPYVVTEWVRGTTITTFCQQSGSDQPFPFLRDHTRWDQSVERIRSRGWSCGQGTRFRRMCRRSYGRRRRSAAAESCAPVTIKRKGRSAGSLRVPLHVASPAPSAAGDQARPCQLIAGLVSTEAFNCAAMTSRRPRLQVVL
jgi:hypothetical protein